MTHYLIQHVSNTFSLLLGMGKDPMNPNILTPDHLDEAEKEGNPHLVETADGFAQVLYCRL